MIRLCRAVVTVVVLLVAAPATAGALWWWDAYPNNDNTPTQVHDDLGQTVTLDTNPSGQENIDASNSAQPPVILTGLTGPGDIVQIAAGDRHSLLLRRDGSVEGVGDNSQGQLGQTTSSTSRWAPLWATGIRSIAACGMSSFAVTSQGVLEQTGNGINAWQQVLQGVVDVACGANGALAITNDLWVWTSPLGTAGWTKVASFGPGTGVTAQQIAEGANDALVWAGGALYGSGSNADGQLPGASSGNGQFSPLNADPDISLLAVGDNHTMYYSQSKGVMVAGDNASGQLGQPGLGGGQQYSPSSPASPPANATVAALAANYLQSFILYSDGSLFAAGDNSSGQLGLGSTGGTVPRWTKVPVSGVLAVAAGPKHTLILVDGGMVMAAGDNTYGQLGLPVSTTPTATFQTTAR